MPASTVARRSGALEDATLSPTPRAREGLGHLGTPGDDHMDGGA